MSAANERFANTAGLAERGRQATPGGVKKKGETCDLYTTHVYIPEAENRGATFGTPFLPSATPLVESPGYPPGAKNLANMPMNLCEGGDLNPYANYGASTSS